MDNSKYIKTLTIIFDCEISQQEVVLFRGAILNAVKHNGNILFHNHVEDNVFRYSYPLIQYKRFRGKANIICVEEGTQVIAQLLSINPLQLSVGKRNVEANIEKILPHRILLQTWKTNFEYRIKNWLPLNSDNYQKYQKCSNLTEKIQLLEQILKGNLLSFFKGVGLHITEEIEAKISYLSSPRVVTNKGVRLMAFDIDFSSNLSIPNYIGIGKNASIGFGVITMKNKKSNK